jgi:hypothetical protein
MSLLLKLASVALVLAALGGCAAPTALSFSVPNVGYSTKKLDAELRSMTVTVGRADEKKGDLPPLMVGVVPALWQTALQEALNKMAIFKDDAPIKVNLSAKILALDIPFAGFSFTTKTIARYELTNRANGDVIYTSDIESTGTVPADYAFEGGTRQRESVSRAVQNNITQFLQALEAVNVQKPMFPTAKAQ